MAPMQEKRPQETKKRGRKPKKEAVDGYKEARKANFIKKILGGDKVIQKASYHKRKPTLKKKALELGTLCDVSVCVVCFGPDGSLDVFPEQESDVKNLIAAYRKLGQKEKKESNFLNLMQAKKRALEKKREKAMKKNIDGIISNLSKQLDGLSGKPLMDSVKELEAQIKNLKERIELLSKEQKGKAIQVDDKKNQLPSSLSSLLESSPEDLIDQLEERKGKAIQVDDQKNQLQSSLRSLLESSPDDLFGQLDCDNNWLLDCYMNLDNNSAATNYYDCCNLDGSYYNENPMQADNNVLFHNVSDYPFGFAQAAAIPEKTCQENYCYEVRPISAFVAQPQPQPQPQYW